MRPKNHLFYWGLLYVLMVSSCQNNKPPITTKAPTTFICPLENDKTNYRLHPFVQILEETDTPYTITEIIQSSLQAKFQAYPNHSLTIQNYTYYWGKIQIENRMTHAAAYTEWVLAFSSRWTSLDIYTKEETGNWKKEQNGTFTPDHLKKYAPTAAGNLVKLSLPPDKVVTIYFRGISERTATIPSFYLRLKHVETFYQDLLEDKVANAFFMGFLTMMFLYNLILYFYGRDRSFIFYSGYLAMILVYAAYNSVDFADWFGEFLFPNHPQYLSFSKLSIYLGLMYYVAFIRSFLDLEHLLPGWDKFLKIIIYLGFPFIVLDVIVVVLTNFSHIIEDVIVVSYIILVIISCCLLLYPLYKTKDKKGYFIIAGITVLTLGAGLTVLTRIQSSSFSIFYLKIGTAIEVIIFSLGLAYRLRQQKQAEQQAVFKLRGNQLIQQKKQLETDRLKELDEFKTRFYTNITHEFRTPLTVILGMAQQITDHPDKHMKEGMKMIINNGRNLLDLVNKMLNLSRLESGKMTLELVQGDVILFLRSLVASFHSYVANKEIQLHFLSEVDKVVMDYDADKLQQVVSNLISNAFKFTPEKGQIYFSIRKENESLIIRVKDTGRGIPDSDLLKIFDRFYQVDNPATRQYEGTGIGLALCEDLIKLMDGKITVQSPPAGARNGSVFVIVLPIRQDTFIEKTENISPVTLLKKEAIEVERTSTNPVTGQFIQELKQQTGHTGNPLILLVEDNTDVVDYVATCLTDYRLAVAGNGQEGFEIATEIIPDLIISDVMMPVMDGFEFCRKLKLDQRTDHIPVIILTARADMDSKLEGLELGTNAYLLKPFKKQELRLTIDNLFGFRDKLRQHYQNIAGLAASEEPSVESSQIPNPENVFVTKTRECIEAHMDDINFNVEQLAQALHLSHSQFGRKLNALTGYSPNQFIRFIRLKKAKELLRDLDLSVTVIAYDCGFKDASYFTRVFKKEMGKTPGEWRVGLDVLNS